MFYMSQHPQNASVHYGGLWKTKEEKTHQNSEILLKKYNNIRSLWKAICLQPHQNPQDFIDAYEQHAGKIVVPKVFKKPEGYVAGTTRWHIFSNKSTVNWNPELPFEQLKGTLAHELLHALQHRESFLSSTLLKAIFKIKAWRVFKQLYGPILYQINMIKDYQGASIIEKIKEQNSSLYFLLQEISQRNHQDIRSLIFLPQIMNLLSPLKKEEYLFIRKHLLTERHAYFQVSQYGEQLGLAPKEVKNAKEKYEDFKTLVLLTKIAIRELKNPEHSEQLKQFNLREYLGW